MSDLSNKTIFITGASSGIGAACAVELAKRHARLILAARRQEALETWALALKKIYPVNIHVLPLDVRDHDAVHRALAELPEAFQAIDVLINNAGLALGLDKMHEAKMADWDTMIDTNIKGILHCTRALLPGMLARGCGHIVQIGSTSAHQTYAGGSVYCATKHALRALTKALAIELAGTPLRVTEIDPGMVETEFSTVRFNGDTARAKKVYEQIQALSAEDVADAVVYAITRPSHVNIAQILLYSIDQPASNRV